MEYIKIATGTAADGMAFNAGWDDYAQHVADSNFAAGYYIADFEEVAVLTADEVQQAERVEVDVVCNVAHSFCKVKMPAIVVRGECYVDAGEFEGEFL